MEYVETFEDFRNAFFAIFTQKTFRRVDYLAYLEQPEKSRANDEASIVDTAIVSPLLGILGFAPAERVYNQQRQNGRPDFAPTDAAYGTCFMVEDKNTTLELTLDLTDPNSHLSQLAGYIRAAAVRLGWLTNGRRLMIWNFAHPDKPTCLIDLDIPVVLREWQRAQTLSPAREKALRDLFDLCRKASFSDTTRLERELGAELEEWQAQALPLGTDIDNERVLVEELQLLVMELQRDARRMLDRHLARYADYADKVARLADDAPELAAQKLRELRSRIIGVLTGTYQKVWGLETDDLNAIEDILTRLEQDVDSFFAPKDVLLAVLTVINEARQRKYADKPRLAHPMSNLDDINSVSLRGVLQAYCDMAFEWHKRRATFNHDYERDRKINDDYHIWMLLVKETMLGDLNEEQRRDEFALQAAYVVFIRLLLIRVCEDKGIFPYRFISDGGIKHWQEDIERWWVFAQGNPYEPLLDMAYANAQNIYAHFFMGRELFNWYQLDRQHFIMALHRLSRFNFAGVDSDIIGTIYNTYVNRKEKREKGQYYTPSEIVGYILDSVGYTGASVIGSNKRLIDPACGSGSFLVSAARRFIDAYKRGREQVDDPVAVLERLQQNLFGFDLNPFACYLAEVNLLIQVLDLVKMAHDMGRRPTIERFHIYNVDALARPTGRYYYTHFNILLAQENDIVEQIKSRRHSTPYEQGFAFVVANPPYGATLSEEYKNTLRNEWADVFYGQPDTYTFFLKLGLELLAVSGKLGFITPNTYLMGTHTATLRNRLLAAGCIEQIVDLPQGIWPDANVDCVLLFLKAENNEEQRRAQQVHIHMLGLRDTLDKLSARAWTETLVQAQSRWIDDLQNKFDIRHDVLMQKIEEACVITVHSNGNGNGNGSATTKILRLVDVADSTQGIIPYHTKTEGKANPYIRTRRNVPPNEPEWKPLLDGNAFVGRYELRWSKEQPYLKYGNWLYSVPHARFFDSPKLLVQDMRNRALKRRLVATYDDQQFYNRHNFSDIIAKDPQYDLKYVLALFNSSLLNYWFARRFDNVHINPSYFRQLPIYPADPATQAIFVQLVNAILAKHAELNVLRAQGYMVGQRRNGDTHIDVPYDILLQELQTAHRGYPVLTLYDAKAMGLFDIPERCDLQASISSNIYVSEKYPTSLVLRHNKLWFDVSDSDVRRYLLNYLRSPRWQGKTWDEIKNVALIPEDPQALRQLFAAETQQRQHILTLLEEIQHIDAEIDERVLDLYGITDQTDRKRVLGSVPAEEVDVAEQNVENE